MLNKRQSPASHQLKSPAVEPPLQSPTILDFPPTAQGFIIRNANAMSSAPHLQDLLKSHHNRPRNKSISNTHPSTTNLLSVPELVQVDDYGFLTDGSDLSDSPTSRRTVDTGPSLLTREEKWRQLMMRFPPDAVRRSRKARKLVRAGVPDALRGRVWQFLANVDHYYVAHMYNDYLSRDRLPIYESIERDIQRCYPNHILFIDKDGIGQESLHNVLKAYAQYNPQVGYCQGMGRVAGLMLMHMSEEEAFWLLVATIDQHMTDYYNPTLSRLKVDSEVLNGLLHAHSPKLYMHLLGNDVVPLMYMTPWFLTIFTQSLPWVTVLRVWDLFFFAGSKMLFRIALGMLECCREHLMKVCPTNTEILAFLLHIPHEYLQPDRLMDATFKIRLKKSEIERWTRRVQDKMAALESVRNRRKE